jgi:RIO kinase 1
MNDALQVLLADGVIDEVLGRLKSGKEADISLVRRGDEVLAAKVYKDRATRSFKNNADYKEGRKVRNTRTQRAMDSGGRFGRDAAEQAWKSAEADALYRLVDSGVRAPAPILFHEGVLLMELVRDAEGRPAPRLIDVTLDPAAAVGVYADLLAQLIALLCCDLIHGDLSPYNILAAADGPTIIDFPQVISAVHSSRAEFFFLRDFDNVVRFVTAADPALAIHQHHGRAIWRAYVSRELTRDFVPPPPPPPDRRRPPRPDQRRGDGPRGDGPRGNDTRRNDTRRNDARPGDNRASGPPRRDQPSQFRPSDPRRSDSPPRSSHAAQPQRASSTSDRAPISAQRPPSRSAPPRPSASPPPGRGRRRRPKRHW